MTESVENGEIVNTIIRLAQSLKMKVIAEGIESASQFEKLKQLNCEYGQGYFFSKPLEAAAAKVFIDEMNSDSPILLSEQVISIELNM
jgi:EAL domain-containing protein (putative c-di-GMP-specific phosphodiesterase class I)